MRILRNLIVTGALVSSLAGSLIAGSPSAADSTTSTTTTSTTSTTTTTTTLPKTTTRVPRPRRGPVLGIGDHGSAVLIVQRELSALGYWLGPPDGVFGDATQQAVYALQKSAGLSRNGVVGPSTYAALAKRVRPVPKRASGNLVEVDLGNDVLMILRHGKLYETLNTSTGGGYTYYDQGTTSVAETPQGVFHVYRQVDGLVVDTLGALWRPKYFDSGFAIHGDSYVPPYPVSHGCVRVSNEAIDWIWADNVIPLGTKVWVYG